MKKDRVDTAAAPSAKFRSGGVDPLSAALFFSPSRGLKCAVFAVLENTVSDNLSVFYFFARERGRSHSSTALDKFYNTKSKNFVWVILDAHRIFCPLSSCLHYTGTVTRFMNKVMIERESLFSIQFSVKPRYQSGLN